jgi:sec-independent protein translocase protein TatC
MISYYKYYLEIKNRFFLLIICWGFVSMVCYLYKEPILFLLIKSSSYLQVSNDKPYFIFTDISEIFYVYLQLTFFISNQVVIAMLFYHTLLFLSSGLYQFEYRKLQFAFKVFILAWLSSIFLLNKFIIPLSWSFFLSFQQTENISFFFEAKIVEYFNYFTNLYYICFINCQILTVITLLLNNFSKNLKKIRKFRKLFYLIFVIFSTLTTPPDIISQVLVSVSLIASYELLLFSNILKINKAAN